MLDLLSHTRPQILISPFGQTDFISPPKIVDLDVALSFTLNQLVGTSESEFKLQFTKSGRHAISLVLGQLNLGQEDEVLIFTTTQSPYISSCVTNAIEQFCRWSREISSRTAAVFCIHEFGFPAKLPVELRKLKVPIISDCAYGVGLERASNASAFAAEHYIFSFSKAFPMPSGGALVTKVNQTSIDASLSSEAAEILGYVAYYLTTLSESISKRRKIWDYYRKVFECYGYSPHPIQNDVLTAVPHAFIVSCKQSDRLLKTKNHLHSIQIESSVYFENDGYFLPCHQNLSTGAVDYIVAEFLAGMKI